ncbi:hypothetical protein O9H85_25590 [Paenibacillus filicis]|uniref:DUF2524 domain-containing protein n=1 Tax=Paenibacillus gyeongsangnamensis TaxID=3388067 RepID=A0ABT4QFT1_9BACL|nr:hypothetical protein [Paenibacillus filicis]MCZ8515723.1 hypothetical protein [Paenibacillus filicis]
MPYENRVKPAAMPATAQEAVSRELMDLETRLNELKSEVRGLLRHDRHRRAVIRAEKQFVEQRIRLLQKGALNFSS